jgi:hypothetical protein
VAQRVFSASQRRSRAAPPTGETRFALRHLPTRVRVRLRRWSLDAALAAGADPCESPTLACRAAQLVSEGSREKVAASIDDVLAAAARPGLAFSAALDPDRKEVAIARPHLIQVQALLRSKAPVYCQGVAMLERVLRDGGSSLYFPVRQRALTDEVEAIIGALEGRQQTR